MINNTANIIDQPRTVDQIQADRDLAIKEERYEDAAQFRDELKNIQWKESWNTDIITQAQALVDEAAAEEHKKEMETAINKEEQDKEAKIKELTDALNGSTEKNDKLENQINLLKIGLEKIRQDRKNKIDEIKNANTSDIDKLKAELKKIQEEKAKLEQNFFGKIKFNDNIKEDDIKKITSKMYRIGVSETDQRGRKKLVWFEKMPIHMTRRRMTIKTIANNFNQIKDNPTQGVDFVMAFTQTRFGRYSRQEKKMTRRNMLRKVNIGRNLESFGPQYNKQKEKLMTVLTWGSKIEDLPPEEKVVLTAIEKRIDYYGKQYIQNTFNQTIGKSSK